MRNTLTALLLATATIGLAAPAFAQMDEPGERSDRAERAMRPDMGERATGGLGERSRNWARPAPVAQDVRPAAVPASDGAPRQWRGGGDARAAERPSPDNGWRSPNRAEVERQGWRGRWENGGAAVPAAPAPVASTGTASSPADGGRWRSGDGNGRPDWRRNDDATRPDWRRDNDRARPDWRRDDSVRDGGNGRDQAWRQRRDEEWRRNQEWQRNGQWQRERQWRDQQWRDRNENGHWSRDDRRYGQDRRLTDRHRWQDQRRWNDGWRHDRRYDWRDYRRSYASVYRLPPYRAPYGWSYGYRRFSVGIFLSNFLFASNYWINDPFAYRLPPAYGALRWVRYYDDALLVDVRDGYVVDVVYDVFW